MIETLLWLILAITLTIFLIRLLARGAMRWSSQLVRSRFRAAEHIIEEETAPEEWIAPYRRRIGEMRLGRQDKSRAAQVAQRARRRCTRKLDGLVKFFESTPFVDTPGARHLVVRRLQNQRRRLIGEEWQTFLTLETEISTERSSEERCERSLTLRSRL
jgi:hypothetical protein